MPTSRRQNLKLLLTLTVAGFVWPASLHSQQDDDVIRVNTELVVLNITVTDKADSMCLACGFPTSRFFEDGKEVRY